MLDLLTKRRSIRKFKENKVEKEKIDKLIKAALLSPSSRNILPWEFVVVTDKELLERLSYSKKGSAAFLKGAPLGIVVLGEPEKSDVWIEDTSITSILIQIVAESIGLGSCWIQIRERKCNDDQSSEEYVKEVLNIPKDKRVESIIAIGYPDEHKAPHKEEDLRYDKVYINEYGKKF